MSVIIIICNVYTKASITISPLTQEPDPGRDLPPGLGSWMLTLSCAGLGGDESSSGPSSGWFRGCPNECNGSSASFVKRNVNYFSSPNYVANESLTEITFPLITLA